MVVGITGKVIGGGTYLSGSSIISAMECRP